MQTAEQKIETLKAKMPEWFFRRYSTNPDCQTVSCLAPSRTTAEAWRALNAVAFVSEVCGPIMTVDKLRETVNEPEFKLNYGYTIFRSPSELAG